MTELRVWDLDESSSRYDHSVAVPSDQTIFTGLTGFAILSFFVSVFVLIQLLSIITRPSVRSKAFNLYLFFLVIPDFLFSFLCGITCALCARAGHYTSHFMCEFQTFYTIFGFAGSSWMNALIARELHTMIRYSYGRRRYFPPTTERVCKQALMVYAWSAFVSSWTLIKGLPHKAVPYRGTSCLPIEQDSLASVLFFWLVFVPAMMVIPFSYVMYVWFDIFYHKLLPITGRTRMIFFYFLRLVVVYLVMWLPTAVMLFVVVKDGYWTSWSAGAWSHLQGLVSVTVSLHKPDIRQAFFDFLCCRWGLAEQDQVDDTLGTGWKGSLTRQLRRLSAPKSMNSNKSQASEQAREGESQERELTRSSQPTVRESRFHADSTTDEREHELCNTNINSGQNTMGTEQKSTPADKCDETVDVELPSTITAPDEPNVQSFRENLKEKIESII